MVNKDIICNIRDFFKNEKNCYHLQNRRRIFHPSPLLTLLPPQFLALRNFIIFSELGTSKIFCQDFAPEIFLSSEIFNEFFFKLQEFFQDFLKIIFEFHNNTPGFFHALAIFHLKIIKKYK